MKDKALRNYEDFTPQEKFMDAVMAFKMRYKIHTGKTLTNEMLGALLGIKREHFQKLMSLSGSLDEAKAENLLARYIVWEYATKMGIDGEEALFPTKNSKLLVQSVFDLNEKPGAVKLPDIHLLTQLRQQIDQLLSLYKPSTSGEVPNEENVNQGAAYSGFEQDKSQKADKR